MRIARAAAPERGAILVLSCLGVVVARGRTREPDGGLADAVP